MLNDAIKLFKACDGLTVEEAAAAVMAYKASKEPKLTLEVGKRYWRRDGRISGPLTKDEHEVYPFDDARSGERYTPTGKEWPHCKSDGDLIREYIPHSADWDALCNAVREIDAEAADYMEVECPELRSFYDGIREGCELQRAFRWVDTPQGFDFWCALIRRLPKPFGSAPEPKKKYEGWVNVYSGGALSAYRTKEGADEIADPCRVDCIHIEWEA